MRAVADDRCPSLRRVANFGCGPNDIVAKVGGRAPLSIEQFLARRRTHFDTSGPNFVPAS